MGTIPYNDYVKIKNKYCIQYYGVTEFLLIQLIKLKKIALQKYPEIDLYISCNDKFHEIYKKDTIPKSKTINNQYAYIKKITYDNVNNPVQLLAKESEIDFQL
jgi:hypothetical protein